MGNENKNNQNTILNAKVNQKAPEATESELNAALGKVVPPVDQKVETVVTTTTTTATTATATPEATPVKSKFDRLVEGLSATNKGLLDSLKGSPKAMEIAEALFKAEHPQGLVKEFQMAAIEAVKKAAEENLVTLAGYEVLVRFPVGDGLTPNTEFVKVGTYRAAEAKTWTKL